MCERNQIGGAVRQLAENAASAQRPVLSIQQVENGFIVNETHTWPQKQYVETTAAHMVHRILTLFGVESE